LAPTGWEDTDDDCSEETDKHDGDDADSEDEDDGVDDEKDEEIDALERSPWTKSRQRCVMACK
jgi:hypothetical protein